MQSVSFGKCAFLSLDIGGVLLSEIAGRGWSEPQPSSAENPKGGYTRARQWYKAFADYVKENCRELAPRADQMATQLESLRKVRNAIVHAGGQLSSTRAHDPRQLRGIYSLQGSVFVSEQGEQTLRRLANETTDLLVDVAKGMKVSQSLSRIHATIRDAGISSPAIADAIREVRSMLPK